MLSGTGWALWHSAVQLVCINKIRGHDIARALVEDNLTVSPQGTFALRSPISDSYERTKPFKGYRALRDLFIGLMQKVYGSGVILMLSADVDHFLDTLKLPVDDRLVLHHAVFLPPTGRMLLCIKLHSLVRFKVNLEGFSLLLKGAIHEMMKNLPYLTLDPMTEETDNMHILFRCLRQYGVKRKNEDKQGIGEGTGAAAPQKDSAAPQKDSAAPQKNQEAESGACVTSAYSLIALHCNACLHLVSYKDMVKQLEVEKAAGELKEPSPFKKQPYCIWEVIHLLHFHMPLFLPAVQYQAMEMGLWRFLEMGAMWPRDEVFHYMTPKRIGPTPTMTSLVTYRSNGSLNLGGHYAYPLTYDTYAWAMQKDMTSNEVKRGYVFIMPLRTANEVKKGHVLIRRRTAMQRRRWT